MPNVKYPSGLVEYENMNKNSTHPNPWGPPSMFDQMFHQHSAAYKIYRPKIEENFMKPDPTRNQFKTGPFSERFGLWTYRGFLAGLVVSYVDLVFVTQSRNLRTNIARVLYLTPPVMTLPMAYITSRELLGSVYGEDKVWTYAAAAVPPGCIWAAFRKRARPGIVVFALMAFYGVTQKADEDLGGILWGRKVPQDYFDKDRPLGAPFQRKSLESWSDADPGPYWKQFVDDKQDPNKNDKV